jgi:hypothetical protein
MEATSIGTKNLVDVKTNEIREKKMRQRKTYL